jgi:hypothetical protein
MRWPRSLQVAPLLSHGFVFLPNAHLRPVPMSDCCTPQSQSLHCAPRDSILSKCCLLTIPGGNIRSCSTTSSCPAAHEHRPQVSCPFSFFGWRLYSETRKVIHPRPRPMAGLRARKPLLRNFPINSLLPIPSHSAEGLMTSLRLWNCTVRRRRAPSGTSLHTQNRSPSFNTIQLPTLRTRVCQSTFIFPRNPLRVPSTSTASTSTLQWCPRCSQKFHSRHVPRLSMC